jgi:hypothetical protein
LGSHGLKIKYPTKQNKMQWTYIKNIFQIVAYIIAFFALLGTCAAVIYSNFQSKRTKQASDGVETENQISQFWKDQVAGFKEMVADQNAKIAQLTADLNTVKGQLMEKDKQLQLFKDIVAMRDPETKEFQKIMIQSVADNAQYRKETSETFSAMLTFLKGTHEKVQELNTQPSELNITGKLTTNK